MRECSKCKNKKPLSEFNKHERGLTAWCKDCVRERSRQYYKEKSNVLKEKRKHYYEQKRQWFNDYKKTLKCSKCDENHIACLEFHHLNPKEKDFTISEALQRLNLNKDLILKEIEKCEVLCSNCHRKLHYKEQI
jgi:hypothetical protein